MEAKTVINLTIDSYNDNDPKHGLRGVPGLAPNLITRRKEQQMWDMLKRNWYEWNINCPIDSKNDYKEEHEVYQANYQLNKNTQLEVLWCEHCNYTKQKLIK